MKRILVLLTIVLAFTATSAFATAIYPVSVGDTVSFADSLGQVSAGQFTATVESGALAGYDFGTFCLEKNETIYLGSVYTVSDISDGAIEGGVAGGNPDYLSDETKWLYYQFVKKENGAFGLLTTENKNSAFQLAIWKLEEEIADFSGYNSTLTSMAEGYIAAAENAILAGEYTGGVKVMNIVSFDPFGNPIQRQSMLVAPVPEPSTLLLLGSAITGLALFRRRKK